MEKEYFDWICRIVCDGGYSGGRSWRKLLRYLDECEFTYILDMDSNRAKDGTALRQRYMYETGRTIGDAAMGRPCSVLEMMVALALRCEEHLMADPCFGNRTGMWFWEMIANLGLSALTDERFDENDSGRAITRLLRREYGPCGEGGLFTIPFCKDDLRDVDIWYQLMWYLTSKR
jgi:hypothetical protein